MTLVIRVKCQLRECLFYNEDPAGHSICRCSHPEKKHYLQGIQCPLYRLDWTKKSAQASEILDRIRNAS